MPANVRLSGKLNHKRASGEENFIDIINLQGEIIYRTNFYSDNTVIQFNINISKFLNGLYICRIGNGKAIKAIKFIKK